jgi:hypothetical protein
MSQRAAAPTRLTGLLVSGASVCILLLILVYLRLPAPSQTSRDLTQSSAPSRDEVDAEAWPRPSPQLCRQVWASACSQHAGSRFSNHSPWHAQLANAWLTACSRRSRPWCVHMAGTQAMVPRLGLWQPSATLPLHGCHVSRRVGVQMYLITVARHIHDQTRHKLRW